MHIRSLTVLAVATFVLGLWAAPAWAVPNLSITKEGPARVEPGEEFIYTVDVRNTGDTDATAVVVTDRLPEDVTFVESDPAGCTAAPDPTDPSRELVTCNIGTLAASGGSRTIDLTVRAPADAGEITNRATVDSNETDPQNSNATTTTVVADLVISKLDDPDPVREENLLLYTLRVTNQGDSLVNDVVILDDLPLDDVDFVRVRSDAFDCNEDGGLVRCDGSLGSDKTGTVDIVVEAEREGDVTNTARVRQGAVLADTATQRTVVEARDDNGGDNDGSGDGDSNVDSGNSNSCSGAEEEETLSGTGTSESATVDITGNKFKITSTVSNLGSSDTFRIRVEDDEGNEVDTFTQDSNGKREFTVSDGSGKFTVEIRNPDRAHYTVRIDDCTGSDNNNNNNSNNSNNSNDNNSNNSNNESFNDLFNDFNGSDGLLRGEDSFHCQDILDINRSSSRNQYNFSSARLQECLEREVIDDVKGDRLANTGGPPLLPMAAFVLIGAGIFLGRSVFRGRER